MYGFTLVEFPNLLYSDSFLWIWVVGLCMLMLIPVLIAGLDYISRTQSIESKYYYSKHLKIKRVRIFNWGPVTEAFKEIVTKLDKNTYFCDHLSKITPHEAVQYLVSNYGYNKKIDVQFIHTKQLVQIKLDHPTNASVYVIADYDKGFGAGIRIVINRNSLITS